MLVSLLHTHDISTEYTRQKKEINSSKQYLIHHDMKCLYFDPLSIPYIGLSIAFVWCYSRCELIKQS